MEGIGSEVSQKIRAAIKAKLIELGAYVDDELPDYIMVMVANKRTRSQMDEDLQLFLASNTKIFTSWLHTVLQKLQEVTVASFENKKDTEDKKSKHKTETESTRSGKSSEETVTKTKKHSKKHKDEKKVKKNKHKSKEKKIKTEKKDEKKIKLEKEKREEKTSQEKEKLSKSNKFQLNDVVGKAILGNLKKNKKLKSDKDESSSQSSSSSEDTSDSKEKLEKESENDILKQSKICGDDDVLNITADNELEGNDVIDGQSNRNELIDDEFNIEPLKPTEKSEELELSKVDSLKGINRDKDKKEHEKQIVVPISAPTEELLKEHDKLQNKKLEGEEKEKNKYKSDVGSDDSLSPEEMRKQLLLSRAKKKLEESKLAKRMRSNSPDVLILKNEEKLKEPVPRSGLGKPETRVSGSTHSNTPSRDSHRSGSPNRRSRFSHSSSSDRSHSSNDSRSKEGNSHKRLRQSTVKRTKEDRKGTESNQPNKNYKDPSHRKTEDKDEKKKNIIKISESLELEKNLGVKREKDKKLKEKETTSKRKVISSRVVTISGPEAPEIPSIVKVKPREYISKDKQANKALILKAVADAQKSIATVHARTEPEPEPKKPEGLFTKNLRGKRYEKLAITLSNVRKSSGIRDRLERRVSVESEKSEKSQHKRDSSDVSGGVRGRSELSKKLSKSEDQFISSKTSIMEKNDKYIRCWLEGVEKAVKEDRMVNPSEMEDSIHSNYTDEENDLVGSETLKEAGNRKRKRPSEEENFSKNKKLSEKEMSNLRVMPKKGKAQEEPQIVVTLDGLNSKTIKELILRNKEKGVKTVLSSGKKLEVKDKSPPRKKPGLEKISDRFGRLNKTNEKDKKNEKKTSGYSNADKEKKEKAQIQSKNRQLIAKLSEKFGKVDREFENKKRKRPDDDRRYSYDRRSDKDRERNGKYKRSDRKSIRDSSFGLYRRSS